VIYGSCSAFWCIRGTKCRCTIFHAWVCLVRYPPKACRDTLHRTCVFSSCGSRSAFWCVLGVKCWRTIFHAQVGLIRIPQKARQDTLRQTCVFRIPCDLRVTLCILVCSGCEMSTHYFSFTGAPVWFPPKACRDTLQINCDLHPVGSAGHEVHSGVFGA
jgi:ABC-type uncharacterized transport system permease subunit